jgi:hypothetical protein
MSGVHSREAGDDTRAPLTDEEILAVLARYRLRMFRTGGHRLVDRQAILAEVGEDVIRQIDAWVAAREGWIDERDGPTSRGIRARAMARMVHQAPVRMQHFEIPALVFGPTAVL